MGLPRWAAPPKFISEPASIASSLKITDLCWPIKPPVKFGGSLRFLDSFPATALAQFLKTELKI